jgi:hypothetical protein
MSLPDTMKSSYTVIRTPCDTFAPTSKTNSVKSCRHCKKQSTSLKQCADCIGIFYCSRECQVTDWKQHKTECTEIFFADMFKLFEVVQMADCQEPFILRSDASKEPFLLRIDASKEPFPKNTVSDHIQKMYFEMLKYMTKIVSLLKNYYKDGHNPCLKKESPYICPVGQNYVHPMYVGEVFGVILYNSSSNPSSFRRVLPDMCYVDYDAISSFLTYYKLESARLIELATELTRTLSDDSKSTERSYLNHLGLFATREEDHLKDIQTTIKQVTTVVKRSRQFVLHCLQQDLKGVHTYRVIPLPKPSSAPGKVVPKTRIDLSEFEDFKIPVSISIQETPQDLIQKLKLDPKHLPYHILIRAKTPVITAEKLPLFHDEFMKHIVSLMTSQSAEEVSTLS